MTTPSLPPQDIQPRDAGNWANNVTHLKVSDVPRGATSATVDGRRVVGPLQGFGPMWQKTYNIRLDGCAATPVEVIKAWKENFPQFWPKGNRFYASITGIAPGEVALLRLAVGGMPLSTGVMVLYADEESFTLMTPEGHVFAGWITFSAYAGDGCTVAQAQVLMRANDPLYELGLRFGGHRQEDKFWHHTLQALAAYFGVHEPVTQQVVCVDRRIQWRYARNIWRNAALGTSFYIGTTPFRWAGRIFRSRG